MATVKARISMMRLTFGCDPEFFFAKRGRVVGAEKILPQDGIVYEPGTAGKRDGDYTTVGNGKSKVIIDGVQAELNPRPNTCRANLGNEISACFRSLYEKIKDDPTLKVKFSPSVKVTKKEMQSLSEKSKQFGCAPSKNAYRGKNKVGITDASQYFNRGAGGHLHFGSFHEREESEKKLIQNAKRIVPMLDILLGNTCVLIDRDPSNVERRKHYGRAGEYRLPPHGLEYRTLSNFWLKSYQLMGFVTGLGRQAISIVRAAERGSGWEKAFLEAVDMKDIRKAINKNDYDLALKNFNKIAPLIKQAFADNDSDFALHEGNIDDFLFFVDKSIDQWFKQDPLDHWMHLPEGHDTGWEAWLKENVRPLRLKARKQLVTK